MKGSTWRFGRDCNSLWFDAKMFHDFPLNAFRDRNDHCGRTNHQRQTATSTPDEMPLVMLGVEQN